MEESKEVIVQECELTEMISINVICRLCANQNDKLIGIYSEDGINNDLANKMNMYLPVKVAETDDLPLQCCWQCASTVLAWHDLVLSSVEADRRLRNCEFITTKVVSQDEDEQMDAASDTTIQEDCEADLSLEETVTEELKSNNLYAVEDHIDQSLSHKQQNICKDEQSGNIKTESNTLSGAENLSGTKPETVIKRGRRKLQIESKTQTKLKQDPRNKDNQSDLAASFNNSVNLDSLTCLLCITSYKNKLLLKAHMKTIHNLTAKKNRRKKTDIELKFFCTVCNTGFTRKYDMEKHMSYKHLLPKKPQSNAKPNSEIIKSCTVLEEGITMYQCDICHQKFSRSFCLIRHRRIHSGDKPYCCHICGKNFRVGNGLTRHINEHHNKLQKFACSICEKKFVSRHSRDEHMNIHTNNRPFICDFCGKAFKQSASLHTHKLFHGDNFRFQCNICSKKFRRARELKVHMWMHTGEKPYSCDVCGNAFRLSQDLKRHLKKHERSSACLCSVCGSEFTQERYLKIHLKTHGPFRTE